MASTTFVDYSTVVPAAWLNDVNAVTYTATWPASVTGIGLGSSPLAAAEGTSFYLYNALNTGTAASNATLRLQSVNRNANIQLAAGATGGGGYQWINQAGTNLGQLTYNYSTSVISLYTGGGTALGINLTIDGRFYGTALHNNAGSVTGTVNQYIASGTYTPTLTNVTNVAASTANVSQWTRIGNVVHVSGQCAIDPTTAGLLSQLDISLPIASNFTTFSECGGTAASANVTPGWVGSIRANSTNDRATMFFYAPTGAANDVWSFVFQYEVLA